MAVLNLVVASIGLNSNLRLCGVIIEPIVIIIVNIDCNVILAFKFLLMSLVVMFCLFSCLIIHLLFHGTVAAAHKHGDFS